MSFPPIRTAVVGVGLAGTVFHLPLLVALPELFVVHTVVERNPQEEGGKARKFGLSSKVVRKYEDALADSEIELVVIGTPNATHYPFAKAALEAGKHVLVDKPITATYEEAVNLQTLANSKQLVLCGHFDEPSLAPSGDSLDIQMHFRIDALGHLTEFESHFDRYRTTRRVTWHNKDVPGSGLVYDLGSHLIDQALVLFGEPDGVTAFLQNLGHLGDVDDNFTILLHYSSNSKRAYPITVILRAHPLSARNPQLRYSLKGTKGSFTKLGVDIQEDQLKLGYVSVLDPAFGVEPEDIHGILEILQPNSTTSKARLVSEKGTFISLYRNLSAAIREGAPLDVTWEEAALTIRIIELAKQSSSEGKTVMVPAF